MTIVSVPQPREKVTGIPSLVPGDHLNQATFHARYQAMPPNIRAELIGGVVYIPSPPGVYHGDIHGELIAWLKLFKASTPRIRALDNATDILGEDSEPQPDAVLVLEGGQTRISRKGYLTGPPEFVAEVALSTESYDLHAKKVDYEKYGVREYLVLIVRKKLAVWFVRKGKKFRELAPGADGILRSPTIPGLWLDADAIFRCDTVRVHEVLRQGLNTPEHAAFVVSRSQSSR